MAEEEEEDSSGDDGDGARPRPVKVVESNLDVFSVEIRGNLVGMDVK